MKNWLRPFLPPIVVTALQRLRPAMPPSFMPSFTWSGVYDGFADVPLVGEAYRARVLAEESAAFTAEAMGAIDCGDASAVPRDSGLLALLATIVAAQQQRVRILDFGGAAGIDYVFLRALTRSAPLDVDYVVVEHPITCDLGRSLHAGDPSIRFEPAIDVNSRPDIVHASASLPYVEQWRDALDTLLSLRPHYFLLANAFVGDFPTFATAQLNLRDTVAPMWFFSKAEIVGRLAQRGYILALEVRTGREYDQSNLPADRRSGRARNLLFRKDRIS